MKWSDIGSVISNHPRKRKFQLIPLPKYPILSNLSSLIDSPSESFCIFSMIYRECTLLLCGFYPYFFSYSLVFYRSVHGILFGLCSRCPASMIDICLAAFVLAFDKENSNIPLVHYRGKYYSKNFVTRKFSILSCFYPWVAWH